MLKPLVPSVVYCLMWAGPVLCGVRYLGILSYVVRCTVNNILNVLYCLSTFYALLMRSNEQKR